MITERLQAVRQVIRELCSAPLPLGTRVRLLSLLAFREIRWPFSWRLPLLRGSVWMAGTGLLFDIWAFREIFVDQVYRTNYRAAAVIDAGAHKGYFGAYAMQRGAASVFSFEPEERNYGFLCRAIASQIGGASEWRAWPEAVSDHAGTGTLHISDHSMAHSLVDRTDEAQIADVPTRLISMTEVIAMARRVSDRVIVKLDVEGAECDIVLNTPIEVWQQVTEIFMETHEFARCGFPEMEAHLHRAGLHLVAEPSPDLYHVARDTGPPCEAIAALRSSADLLAVQADV